jgi:peptidoglycan-N-acetylglucosamine deacetylase
MTKNMPPRFVLILWPVADRLLRVIYRIRPLKADDSGIMRFSLHRYKGPTKVLNDGSKVKTGDTIVELHLNNAWFKRRRNLNLSASQSPREFLGCFAQDLRILAQQIVSGTFGNIAALHGITLLHIAARRLGFQVDELPDSLWKKGARFYMARLMQVYHLRGEEVSGLREKPWELKEVWFSRAALLSQYGPQHL